MKLAYLLGAAVVAAAAYGFAHANRASSTAALPSGDTRGSMAARGDVESLDPGGVVSGKVAETIDVARYTYLRLTTDRGDVWAAVSKADISRGSAVTVTHAARMDHFASKTLNRTFDVIYFGELAGTEGDQTLPPGHPSIEPSPAPFVQNGQALPPDHPEAAATAPVVIPPNLARAPGANGFRIADIFASRERLAGNAVRVRGVVTKVTSDVLGATFLHLRDGSGDDAAKTNDVAVMTSALPKRGDVLIFEGTLRLNADLGIGYRYPALLEKATVVAE